MIVEEDNTDQSLRNSLTNRSLKDTTSNFEQIYILTTLRDERPNIYVEHKNFTFNHTNNSITLLMLRKPFSCKTKSLN